MVHGVVGLQHSSMAIYNAFCDQVPAVVLAGNVGNGTQRRPAWKWAHSARPSHHRSRLRQMGRSGEQSAGLRRRLGARL
jgi:thiamine pyrophosphate-dependent acetolactate synthase large subunit-like protein